MQDKKPFKDRLALVTGASRGIGRAVALELARQGAHVVIVARTIGALEELDDEFRAFGGKATLLDLDIRKGDKIDQLGPTLYQRWGKLDSLVSSAGILGPLSPLHHVTEDAWNAVIETNLSANWRLIRTLDPLLKRSEGGRAVFVTSGAAAARTPIGDRMQSPTRASKRSSRPTRMRSPARHCGSTSSTRGRCAPRCAPRPSPARTR
jgi:NAD(P)-dependent dehydrogenase (short-subunit alcohol dehydrogenase family)